MSDAFWKAGSFYSILVVPVKLSNTKIIKCRVNIGELLLCVEVTAAREQYGQAPATKGLVILECRRGYHYWNEFEEKDVVYEEDQGAAQAMWELAHE